MASNLHMHFAGANMSNQNEDDTGLPNNVEHGISGIFRGLNSLVNAAAKLTEQTDAVEVARNGLLEVRDGVQAAYGVGVRMGPQSRPASRPIRSSRRQAESGPAKADVWEPLTDLFDEGDHYLIVAELSGFDASAVHSRVIGNALLIDAICDHRVYHKELILPCPVKEQSITTSFTNGILELRLWKQ
jgi:HSP20 family protein